MNRKVFDAAILSVFVTAAMPAWADIQLLPRLTGDSEAYATGISDDGTVVSGYGNVQAFYWTASEGTVELTSSYGRAYGVSGDGQVIVGTWADGSALQAFRWDRVSGLQSLGVLPTGGDSIALATNGNGSVVVGYGETPFVLHPGTPYEISFYQQEAFRWTQATGMQGLGFLTAAPGNASMAMDVSADGEVVVGWAFLPAYQPKAFRWTEAIGMVALPGSEAWDYSEARGVSADGSVIVGVADNQAFRWTSGGAQLLGTLYDDLPDATSSGPVLIPELPPMQPLSRSSEAMGVSADGQVVVGQSWYHTNPVTQTEAFRWSASTGMQSVADWLAAAGVSVSPDWRLATARAINADGSVVVGEMNAGDFVVSDPFDPVDVNLRDRFQAYIARVSPFGSGVINPAQFNESLSSSQQPGRMGEHIASLVLNGAHHRLLMDMPVAADRCSWITTDYGKYDKDRDASIKTLELGACHDFNNRRTRIGLGVGQGRSEQVLAWSATQELDGDYVLLEIDQRLGEQWIVSLLGMHGRWDVDAERGYLNAGLPDYSSASTDAETRVLRARLDWQDALDMGWMRISPRLAYTWAESRVDDYTETGGGFPAWFDDYDHDSEEIRLGVDALMPVSDRLSVRVVLDGVRRLDDASDALSGQVLGLYGFSVPGENVRKDWVRLGVDADYRFTENAGLVFSVKASDQGEDPDWSAALSMQLAF